MGAQSLLTDHVATRARSIDFSALGLLLPNPDPILKAQGRDIKVYRDLCTEPLVGAAIRRRKSAVKALQWGLDRGRAASRVAKGVQAMLDRLDMERIIGQMLDATLFGYQPMEVMWAPVDGVVVPVDVQAKPPEWFCFDTDNQLRFKTRANPLFGELLPSCKFLLPRQDPTYQNPYGFPDLSMVFWSVAFMKGGKKFWLAFAEKFGSAFSVGKLPRSASAKERADLLDSLDSLIRDGVSVIPDDGSVELVEMAGKSASSDLYRELVMHCRSEISIALLGQNQTTEASANRASATAGLEVARDLRDGDAEIVAAALNQLIRWIVDRNYGATEPPVFSFWDQEAQDVLQAQRDKSNYDAGARFTNDYWQRAYGYQEGDLQGTEAGMPRSVSAGALAGAPGAAFAEGGQQAMGEPDALAAQAAAAAQPAVDAMVAKIRAVVEQSSSFTEVQDGVLASFATVDPAELQKLMAAAFALAELQGMSAAKTEAKG